MDERVVVPPVCVCTVELEVQCFIASIHWWSWVEYKVSNFSIGVPYEGLANGPGVQFSIL